MKVKVLFFASLREQLKCGSEEIELPPEASTLGALRALLADRGGNWQSALAQTRPVRMAVNQDMVPRGGANAIAIKAGDEIAFFPPVTGG